MATNLSTVRTLFDTFGLPFFNHGLYNVNMFGVRAKNRDKGSFNDIICLAFFTEVGWYTCAFPATTDPGKTYLGGKMINPDGTMLLPASTLVGATRYRFKLGEHRGLYPALLQGSEFKVVRDDNRDGHLLTLDEVKERMGSGETDAGWFGCNIHHASNHGLSPHVGDHSAGCQVIQSIFDWEKFYSIILRSAETFGDMFTYTLFNEEDIEIALGSNIGAFYRLLNDNRIA